MSGSPTNLGCLTSFYRAGIKMLIVESTKYLGKALPKFVAHLKTIKKARAAIVLWVLVFSTFSFPAHAAKKFAWLVGNTNYSGADALRNPGRDVDLLATALKQAGYAVMVSKNLNTTSLEDNLKTFRTRATNADIALLYYAGHGLAFNGYNYMVPVDRKVSDIRSHELIARGISFEIIEDRLRGASVKNALFFVDACRTPPTRGASLNGLIAPKAKSGSLYLFSTQPGGLARDGLDNNSPFAQALAKNLLDNSVSLKQMVQATKADVDLATGGAQVPWVADGLAGDLNLITAQSFIPTGGKPKKPAVSVNTADSKKRSANDPQDTENAKAYWSKYLYDLENEIEILVNSTGTEELEALKERGKNGDSMALTALGYLYLRPNPSTKHPLQPDRPVYAPFSGLPDPYYAYKQDGGPAVTVVKRNPKTAFNYLSQASAKGSLLADTVIGEMYFDGEGVKTSYQKAKEYLEKGSAVGHLRARMGMMALKTRTGEPVDPIEMMNLTVEYARLMASRYSQPSNSLPK